MENKNKTEKLKKLIEGSASFSDLQKESLISKIPELSEADIDAAITIFEDEIKEWKAIYEQHEQGKEEIKEYLTESKQHFLKETQNFVHQAEKEEKQEDLAQVEDLLQTIH